MRPLARFLLLGAVAFAVSRSTALVQKPRDEAALLEQAYRLGLDRRDPVVRRRLVANLRFAGADSSASDEELLREAYSLGMERSDVVVRRRLVQAVEQRSELRRERVGAQSGLPATWRFRHVLVGSGPAATKLRDELTAEHAGPEAGVRRSRPFLLGNRFGPASRTEIASTFGDDVAEAITVLPPGAWSAPIRSAWGYHLVWVEPATP